MDIETLKHELETYEKKIGGFAKSVDREALLKRIGEIDDISMSDPSFWNKKESRELLREQADKKRVIAEFDQLVSTFDNIVVSLELYDEEPESMEDEVTTLHRSLKKLVDEFELKLILGGEHDGSNAILTIHSGAGGTESDDWASMLFRMYSMWAERKGYKFDILDYQEGDEAGIKSATIGIQGLFCYGYLKSETGVHRLVRISPFDSSNRRHTSFASVFVLPEIDDDIEVEINEADLKIDTYRAGGAGGQHVNTTDSAVRITHAPTGIVVTCQNERSQHKNKASAMKILKSRIYEYELNKKNEEKDKLESSKSDIGWGNQIRSYVMHPYKMVKDLRTRCETGNVDAVMDGDLDEFIMSYLLTTAERK